MQFLTEWPVTQYLVEHFDRVWPSVVEHLTICGVSLAIAIVIALPLGLLISRVKSIATTVLIILGILYTIPSFAFFAFLVPFTGIGFKPAIIALSAYALVVLVRNTAVAFNGVDPAVIEAANGMGMSGFQRLYKVEIPLAVPVIVAGLRIATLSTIALATIAAWVGAGGLGLLLKDGLHDPTGSKLYAGVICVGALAVVADLVFRLIEASVGVPSPTRRRFTLRLSPAPSSRLSGAGGQGSE